MPIGIFWKKWKDVCIEMYDQTMAYGWKYSTINVRREFYFIPLMWFLINTVSVLKAMTSYLYTRINSKARYEIETNFELSFCTFDLYFQTHAFLISPTNGICIFQTFHWNCEMKEYVYKSSGSNPGRRPFRIFGKHDVSLFFTQYCYVVVQLRKILKC